MSVERSKCPEGDRTTAQLIGTARAQGAVRWRYESRRLHCRRRVGQKRTMILAFSCEIPGNGETGRVAGAEGARGFQ